MNTAADCSLSAHGAQFRLLHADRYPSAMRPYVRAAQCRLRYVSVSGTSPSRSGTHITNRIYHAILLKHATASRLV